MNPELPDRQKRNSGRLQSPIQSIDRRSGKWSTSPTQPGKIRRRAFQGQTVQTVPPETVAEPLGVSGSREAPVSASHPTSPTLLDHARWEKQGPDLATSFYHTPEEFQTPVETQRPKVLRSASQTSILSRTRVRLNSMAASHSFSTKHPESSSSSNSIGFPSIIATPTLPQQESARPAGGRKLQRHARPAVSTISTDTPNNMEQTEVRFPLLRTPSSAILPLMKTTSGRMHGFLYFRPATSRSWSSGYCTINVTSGSLSHQAKGEPSLTKTLIPDLRGCKVRKLYDADDECNYLSVSTASSGLRLNLWPPVPETFESWLAALLCWQPFRPKGFQNKMTKPQATPIFDRRMSDRARASATSTPRMPAIVKVGKMLLRDASTAAAPLRPTTTRKVSTYKQLRAISPFWQRVSCTLFENGQFKLLTEPDAQVISAIHLTTLSRCAVQQLHPSVLEDEFCLAIYPQYVAQPHYELQSRPVYLSLESRVLLEAWYTLLQAFTVPDLYGPKQPTTEWQHIPREYDHSVLSSSDQGMFRVERSLSIKITEAKIAVQTMPDQALEHSFLRAKMAGPHPEVDVYAEVVLDGEPRGRTRARPQNDMFWVAEFTFTDLPPVLSSALIQLRFCSPESKTWTAGRKSPHLLAHAGTNAAAIDDYNDGQPHDTLIGEVGLQLEDIEQTSDLDRRWPILDSNDTPIGNSLMKIRLTETVVLMRADYTSLLDLLRSFSNRVTVSLTKAMSTGLKQVSEVFLDIFQASGDVSEWLMTLVEDEIDGVNQEDSAHKLYKNRIRSNESYESAEDREITLRDLGRSATLEANLLFRGNTLLTKALDAHMRRLGRDYLEETIGERLRDIEESDPDCEVDPSKVRSPDDLNRNWGNLTALTMNLWTAISSSATRCPTELRRIFRHIKSCAETRYGDFLRTVAYSSVSGFLFLRFFCPAILNPKLFGLLKDTPRPRAQRTLTLIAKSLQGLANMTSFGAKEPWMEPMNRFLKATRPEFKALVDQICSVSSERRSQPVPASYATPIQILGRLASPSREGIASLPYLIDSAKSFAILVSLWVEKRPANLEKIFERDSALRRFHDLCMELHQRTKDYLSNAEPAERPSKGAEAIWERLVEDREHCLTFYEDSPSVPHTPVADVVPGLSREGGLNKQHLFGTSKLPTLPRGRIETGSVQEHDSQQNSASLSGHHSVPRPDRVQPAIAEAGTKCHDNSPTPSLEAVESSLEYPDMVERNESSRSRLFRDFVDSPASSESQEGFQLEWSKSQDEPEQR